MVKGYSMNIFYRILFVTIVFAMPMHDFAIAASTAITAPVNATKAMDDQRLLPHYELMVVAKKPGVMIALYGTLQEPVDEILLFRLGKVCFDEVNGSSYDQVFINWYIEGTSKLETPWAITNYDKNSSVLRILTGTEKIIR